MLVTFLFEYITIWKYVGDKSRPFRREATSIYPLLCTWHTEHLSLEAFTFGLTAIYGKCWKGEKERKKDDGSKLIKRMGTWREN